MCFDGFSGVMEGKILEPEKTFGMFFDDYTWYQEMCVVCRDTKYLPDYGSKFAGAMDLRIVVPEGQRVIEPKETVKFGTGLQVKVPRGYAMVILPRSSTGAKFHCMLANTVGFIDSDYRDEVKIVLTNYGDEEIEVFDAQRICQFYILPIPRVKLKLVEDNAEFREDDRGGGFGSTGRM